ncbi:hypothetical protein [Streptomyces canus]|uniref:hypothetical protein n=1 Tax=Streptomyces canus TaxID=58343 RepID=UPI00224F35C0|nr:hypothetical protein [Streptomyces canus]
MAAREKITVPAHHRVRPRQQPHPAQHLRRQPAQQRCQERPIAQGEPHSPAVELALQYPDLMAKSEDLGVLAMVAHRQ